MRTTGSSLTGWVGLMLVLALSTPGAGIGLPTLETITIDGNMSDWTTVLANPVNVTNDGDGSSYGSDCIGSTDLDCQVKGGTGRDLLTFAWTYDSDNIYLLIERWGSSSNIIRFFFVMDLDGNGNAEASDRVLLVEWSGVKTTFNAVLYAYVPDPAGSGSDSLVDPATGFADGWKMPGSIDAASPLVTYTDVPGGEAATGLKFEAGVPWTDLGLGGPTPINFHVASHNNTTLSEAEDNMGGPDGKLGRFGFTGVDILPAWVKSVGPGELVSLPHTISNQGNLDGLFDLTGRSSLGLSLAYYTDPDGDGAANDLMAIDANGDGDFSDGGDTAPTSTYDTNINGRLDFSIPVGAEDYFVVEVQVPPFLNAVTDYLDFHVELDSPILVEDRVEDQLYIGYFTVYPDRQASAVPGQYVDYGHWVTNNQSFEDTADLSVTSSLGWDVALYSDPDGDGDPVDGIELARDLGGDGTWDSGDPDTGPLAPGGGSAWYVVRVFVPVTAVVGTDVDVTTFTATSVVNANRKGTAADVTTVRERLRVEPDYTFADGTNLYGSAGGSVYFPFRVINSWITADSFTLGAVSAQGWTVVLWSDPNGDGSINDGSVVANTGMVPAAGGWFDLVAEVQVPATALGGDQDTVTVTATSDLEPTQSDSAVGQLEVHLLQTFRDSLYHFQARYFATCETIYTRATGLEAGQATRYTLRYRDSAMALIEESALVTNARGFADASRAVAAGEPLGLWTLEIFDSDSSSVLDFVTIEHERAGAVGSVVVSPDPAAAGNDLQVSAVYANTNSTAPYSQTGATIWVRAPDGSVLQDDGAFVPDTGVEVTQIRSIPPLAAGDSTVDIFAITDVAFPTSGTYTVDIRWDTGCGDVIATLAPSASFQVDADIDLDGVPDSIDICPTVYNPMQDLLADPLACGQCDVACADPVACTDDVCQAGVCDNLPNDLNCPDDGQYCNGTEYCDATDDCLSTGDPCASTGQICNEADDTCACAADAECDDGIWCNGAETCTDGACSAGVLPCAGQICDEANQQCMPCTQDSDCNNGWFCDGEETCVNGTCWLGQDPCPGQVCNEARDECWACLLDTDCEDGLWCTGREICFGGVCLQSGDPCNGEGCDEDNDVCLECTADQECDDGLYCTGDRTCSGGLCQNGADPCPDNVCEEDTDSCRDCVSDDECDDGLYCSGEETCDTNDGTCQTGEDPCPGLTCDEDFGICTGCTEDSECDDGLWCTGAESCVNSVCWPGANPCPGKVCEEDTDSCRDCVSDAECDDGLYCNGEETCVAGTCVDGADPCASGLCNESADACMSCTSDLNCDDGIWCNGSEVCFNGFCYEGPDPCPGQICNEAGDLCRPCADDSECDDGLFCNGAETCQGGVCMVGADPCPGQSCDETGDACFSCQADSDCDDGLWCNGAETCANNACQAGSDPCAGQACDEDNDACFACQTDSDCDDGLYCTGAEVCLGGTCHDGTNPCPGQDCNEDNDICASCSVDGDCDDGLWCNGQETCTAGACQAGADPCDGQECDEGTDECIPEKKGKAGGCGCGLSDGTAPQMVLSLVMLLGLIGWRRRLR